MDMPSSKKFKSYKEKVVFILQSFNENLENPVDLSWCLFVIENDFL